MTERQDPTPGSLSRRRLLGLGLGAAAGIALAGCGLDRASTPDGSRASDDDPWNGTHLDPPFEKPDVNLVDMHGEPFPFIERTEGRLTALFFGYTNCPDVCPVTLQTMAAARRAIGAGPGSNPLVCFIGVDIARDTPERMREYLGAIDSTFMGLTGTEEEIAAAGKHLHLAPIMLEEPDANGNYGVGHPSQVFIFSPDNLAHRMYPGDQIRAQAWANDLPRLDRGITT